MPIPHKPFYFIRHGETDWNLSRTIQGHTDIPLNHTGISQAHSAKQLLQDLTFEHIHTSPLQRAYQTAKILGGSADCLSIYRGLMERKWGEYEGTPHMEHLSSLCDADLPKEAETMNEFAKRVLETMHKIVAESTEVPLIVAHGGVFVVLAKSLVMRPEIRSSNCHPFLFEPPKHDGNQWSICNLSDDG